MGGKRIEHGDGRTELLKYGHYGRRKHKKRERNKNLEKIGGEGGQRAGSKPVFQSQPSAWPLFPPLLEKDACLLG